MLLDEEIRHSLVTRVKLDQVLDHQGNKLKLADGTFYHLTDAHDSLVMHNARLGHGVLSSVSLLAQVPGWEKMTTPYAVRNADPAKEAAWEQERTRIDPCLPSRLKSFYCFETEADAERARYQWFEGVPRKLLKLRIVAGSIMAHVDTNWLNCSTDQWAQNARLYWSGAMKEHPLVEVIVIGRVYFPDWRGFPLVGSQNGKRSGA